MGPDTTMLTYRNMEKMGRVIDKMGKAKVY